MSTSTQSGRFERDLQTTLDNSVSEYNKLADQVSKAQQELLMRQGAIQQLQELIKAESSEESTQNKDNA